MCISIVVSDSNEGSKKAVFYWCDYYGEMLDIEGMEADIVEDKIAGMRATQIIMM